MLFGDNRDQLRQMYRDALNKSESGQPMTALESQIADVIVQHPEYRDAVIPPGAHAQDKLDRDYLPEAGEANPFMHMSLHLAVRDQLATNRPNGIREAFASLCASQDRHQAEHVLCEHMGRELWQSQRDRKPPDEQRYLKGILEQIARNG
ncbi:MAG: DUF1841 family protein [Gammaproteobacteria bacterium]